MSSDLPYNASRNAAAGPAASPVLAEPGPDFLAELERLLGPGGVRRPEEHPGYFEEPRGKLQGRAAAILRPADVDGVAEIIRRCAAARVGVVPYGGGTGLVGGQIFLGGALPVLLSLERMAGVRMVDAEDAAMVVEAGCTVQAAQEAAEAAGLLFPLSYASRGSARIGGAMAVNSGGVGVLRYGNARELCLGLEAVLPDGSVHHGLKLLRKNNTGYDLRHLLIGAEGTLGVITAAALKLYPRPREQATAFAAIPSAAGAVTLLRFLQDRLGETVSACELLSAQGFAFLAEKMPEVRIPLQPAPEWAALIEIGDAGARARLGEALEAAFEAGLVLDAVIAESEAQRAALWAVRENQSEANRLVGAIASHDTSVPVSRMAEFIERAGAALRAEEPDLRINCFGHIGDGNLHYNLFPPVGRDRSEYRDRAQALTRIVHDVTDALGGAFSAEHGVGRMKAGDLARYGDPAKLAAMRAIKAALDPLGIMNPGAVLAEPRGEEA